MNKTPNLVDKNASPLSFLAFEVVGYKRRFFRDKFFQARAVGNEVLLFLCQLRAPPHRCNMSGRRLSEQMERILKTPRSLRGLTVNTCTPIPLDNIFLAVGLLVRGVAKLFVSGSKWNLF